jgi:Bacteriophage minor capsid protein
MNALSIDIKDFIIGDSSTFGLEFANNLFIAREPAKPDNTVTIFDTPGSPSELNMGKGVYYYDSCQIRTRNVSYTDAMTLAMSLMTYFNGKAHETMNNTYYSLIQASTPTVLEWDDLNRVKIIININVQRR